MLLRRIFRHWVIDIFLCRRSFAERALAVYTWNIRQARRDWPDGLAAKYCIAVSVGPVWIMCAWERQYVPGKVLYIRMPNGWLQRHDLSQVAKNR
jgi:hypothetical protein